MEPDPNRRVFTRDCTLAAPAGTKVREGEAPAEPPSRCVYLLRRLSRSFALPALDRRLPDHRLGVLAADNESTPEATAFLIRGD